MLRRVPARCCQWYSKCRHMICFFTNSRVVAWKWHTLSLWHVHEVRVFWIGWSQPSVYFCFCFCFSCCLDLFLFIGQILQILQMQEPALFKHIKLPKNLSPICHSWFPLDKNSWNAGNCDYLSLIRACIQVACFFFNLSKGPPLVITCLQSSSSCLGSTESYCMYSTVHSSVLTRLKIIKHNGLKRFIKTNRIISILF